MKKLTLVAAAVFGLAALASGAANAAGSATGSFNVIVNLTPACQIASTTTFGATATLTDITLNYTAFGAIQQGATSFNVRCSAGLAYDVKVDSDSVSTLGLTYTLGVAPGASTTAYTGGATGLVGEVGATAGKAYKIGAEIAAGQGGTCAVAAGCSSTTGRTVTVSY